MVAKSKGTKKVKKEKNLPNSDNKIYIVVVLLVILNIFFIYKYNVAMKENNLLSSSLSAKEEQIDNLNDDLNYYRSNYFICSDKLDDMNSSLIRLNKTNAELMNTVTYVANEFNELRQELSDFNQTIEEQISFFRNQSTLPSEPQFTKIMKDLRDCYYYDTTKGREVIMLQCIRLVNKEYNGLEYIPDYDKDYLYSIDEFFDRGGGDCEDWAFFFAAEYRYIVNKVSGSDLLLEVLDEGKDMNCGNKQCNWVWYDSRRIRWVNKPNIYVVCGSQGWGGHCMVGFTNYSLDSSVNISSMLESSYFVEPQSGFWYGTYEDMIDDGWDFYAVVFTDDYALYQDGEWVTYHYFLNRTNYLYSYISNMTDVW